MAKFKASLDYVGRILSTKKRGEEEEKEEYLRVTKGSQGKSPPLPILCSPLYKLHTMSHECPLVLFIVWKAQR